MEALENQLNGAPIPSRAVLQALADRFSASPARAGINNIAVDPVQILTWFKNELRQHAQAKPPRYPTRRHCRRHFQGGTRCTQAPRQEVKVRFSGFGAEADEWVYVRKCVPCVAAECAVADCGDPVLCFQATNTHSLYFDAHVTDIRRQRHDVKGCRCRFLIRYDHDESEEIVPLRKLCHRPETN